LPYKELAADDPRHGKASTYSNYSCKCEKCTEAWRIYHLAYLHRSGRHKPMAQWRAEQAARRENNPPAHGTETRYSNYKCRCKLCKKASADARRRRRHANPAATLRYDRLYRGRSLAISVGDFDLSLIRRAEELAQVRAVATGELAELIREQERDEKFGQRMPKRPWILSLDQRDQFGRELIETLVIAEK
jgi:hypothetical protein